MTLAIPLRRLLGADEADICLVDQGRRLQRLAGLFLGQLVRRQLPQLLVHQRQKLLGRLRIALLNPPQDSGDVGHRGIRASDETASGDGPPLGYLAQGQVSSFERYQGRCHGAPLASADLGHCLVGMLKFAVTFCTSS